MANKRTSPFGTWQSDITADAIANGAISLHAIEVDGNDILWQEQRPQELGRDVLVRRRDGETEDVVPAPYNVRTRVHEYGGGAYTAAGGDIYFSNFDDNRLYHRSPGGEIRALTDNEQLRFADLRVDSTRSRLIAVMEDHGAGAEAENSIVAVDLATGSIRHLVRGNDFYAFPAISPDGARLAWTTWNRPNMPWDGCELWLADIDAQGGPHGERRVAGGPDESIFQPQWTPDGTLLFVSDRTGWWNLYRHAEGGPTALTSIEGELGQAQWVFGMSTYTVLEDGHIVARIRRDGVDSLAIFDANGGDERTIETPYVAMASLRAVGNRVVLIGASPTRHDEVVIVDPATSQRSVLRRAADAEIDPAWISVARQLHFPTTGGLTAHGFFYPPTNPNFEGPDGALPPLIVKIHGGPTGAVMSGLNLERQFWTSRGFAVLDLNYGGSTGYGRAYRERLNGEWGAVDVDDAVAAVRYCAEQGLIDPDRAAIAGGSAGGYTTMTALALRDTFTAGCSYFGISDLNTFAHETHKFESRYLDRLIGSLPESEDLYRRRSALPHAENITAPLVMFQGLDDKVVPPNQAELLAEALEHTGAVFAAVYYAGEGHGFRQARNIKRTLEGELSLYAYAFGFEPEDSIEPLELHGVAS